MDVIYKAIIDMPRGLKRAFLLLMDVFWVPVALLIAFALGHNSLLVMEFPLVNRVSAVTLMGISVLLSIATNSYRVQLKSYETKAVGLTAIQTLCLTAFAYFLDMIAGFKTEFSVFVIFGLLYFLLAVSSRVILLQILIAVHRSASSQVRVIIYGAGSTGRQLVAALQTAESIYPVCFVDDDESFHGTIVRGLRVYSPKKIEEIIRRKKVDRILVAMPDLSRPRLFQLTQKLEQLDVDVHTLPSFAQLTQRGKIVDQLEPVSPNYFLGREEVEGTLPVELDAYRNKSILITGAGGSIGSELCRQLLKFQPRKIVLFEIGEHALYSIEMELSELSQGLDVEVVAVLGNAQDQGTMLNLLRAHQVQVVLHAAAYKHVGMVERNLLIGAANNILGTDSTANASREAGVERFILVSTDKAVRPTNFMGATKRVSEVIVRDLARRFYDSRAGSTRFSIVRFGNVIGSSGSVVPLFEDQIRKGGPITLTHPDVTRYFMTIAEASRLVLVAGAHNSSGEVFVLDMGQPVSILSLAEKMIEAAGYKIRDEHNPDGDIEITITGLKRGEKLHEELMEGHGTTMTENPKIIRTREIQMSEAEVAESVDAIRKALSAKDEETLRRDLVKWFFGWQDGRVDNAAHVGKVVEISRSRSERVSH